MRKKIKTKAVVRRRAPVAEVRPQPPALPTRDELLATIAAQLEEVEQVVAEYGDGNLQFHTHQTWGDNAQACRTVQRAIQQMDEVLNTTPDSDLDAKDVVWRHFATKLGEPTRITAPCELLLWFGNIPLRCRWGGFISSDAMIYPLDPRALWISERSPPSFLHTGYLPGGCRTPEAWFRALLPSYVAPRIVDNRKGAKKIEHSLHQMNALARGDLIAWLQDPANGWWRRQVALGPVDPIPLPDGLAPTQVKLFA